LKEHIAAQINKKGFGIDQVRVLQVYATKKAIDDLYD
jgi:hypothetical protein